MDFGLFTTIVPNSSYPCLNITANYRLTPGYCEPLHMDPHDVYYEINKNDSSPYDSNVFYTAFMDEFTWKFNQYTPNCK